MLLFLLGNIPPDPSGRLSKGQALEFGPTGTASRLEIPHKVFAFLPVFCDNTERFVWLEYAERTITRGWLGFWDIAFNEIPDELQAVQKPA
jgi:hypothetical protein